MATNKLMMAATATLLALASAGCSVGSADRTAQGGAAKFAVAAAVGASGVARMDVTISPGDGPAFTPFTTALSASPTGWSGFITQIPAGAGRKFDVTAFDAAGASLMSGTGKVDIVAGAVASVTIVLGSSGTSTPYQNSVPVIDYVAASRLQVRPGETVRVGVSAHDPDPADAGGLTYLWGSSCGAFDAAAATQATWTAPALQGGCQLSVKVTDPHGASLTSYFHVDVQVLTGDVLVDVLLGLNAAPAIAGMTVDARFDTVLSGDLAVTALDADGDVLAYAWTSSCAGLTFSTSAPYSPSAPHFTSSDVSKACVVTVTVTDPPARGGSTTGVIVLPPGLAFNVAPVITHTTQPSVDLSDPLLAAKVTAGELVPLQVYAADPEGAALTFTWTATAGTIEGQADVTTSPGSSAATFHAPSPLAADMRVTVTVKDPAGESNSHVFHFKPSGLTGPCATQAEGSACDDGDACTSGDTCHSGLCVGGTPKTCAAADQCHAAGTCDAATGACSNPARADGSACNDGQACTSSDVCAAGTCLGAAVVCAAQDQCHAAGTCDAATGACSSPAKPDGTACNDANLCSQADACVAGACVGSNLVTCTTPGATCNPATGTCSTGDLCAGKPACTALDQCHDAGACDPATGLCSNPAKADGAACSDGLGCTTTDHCAAGACVATAVVCTAPATCQEPAGTCSAPVGGDPVPVLAVQQGAALGSVLGLGVDAQGNVYQAGNMFQPGFDFGSGLVDSAGSSDAFVVKLGAATGTAAGQWARAFGDAANDQSVQGLAVSGAQLAFIGQFNGLLDLGGGKSINNSGNTVDYVAALGTAAGAGLWAKAVNLNDVAGVSYGKLNAVAGSTAGAARFALCGYAATRVATDLVNDPAAAAGGGMDVVVAVLDAATGTLLWGRQFGGAGDQMCTAVAFDDAGDVLVAGTHAGTLSFPGVAALAQPSGTNRWAFVAKLAGATGAVTAAANFGAATTSRVTPRAVSADASGNVLLAGQFQAALAFGATALTGTGASLDIFAAKLTPALAPTWAVRLGGTGADDGRAIGADSGGRVWVAGVIGGATTGIATLTPAGGTDAFLLGLDAATGAKAFAAIYGDAQGQEANCLAVARLAAGGEKDSIWMTGNFTSEITFAPLAAILGNGAETRKFVVKLQ